MAGAPFLLGRGWFADHGRLGVYKTVERTGLP
jgi:hypothetical protein